MESTEKMMNDLTVSLSDLDMEDSEEIIRLLPDVSISQILECSALYKLALIYASRGSCKKFMKKVTLAGLCTKKTDSLEQLKIQSDRSKALQMNDFDALQKLVELENTSVLENRSWYDLISSALICGCPTALLEFMINKLFDNVNDNPTRKYVLNGFDSRGLTPLIASVLAGNLAAVQFLLEQGADIDVTDASVSTDQLEKDETDSSGVLNEKNKTLYKSDTLYGTSKTALMYAVCTKNLECVKVVLRFKPDLIKKCHNGYTAIGYAVITSNYDCLNLLLTTPVQMDMCELMGTPVDTDQGDCAKSGGIGLSECFDFTRASEENDVTKPCQSKLKDGTTCLKRKKDSEKAEVLQEQPATVSEDESLNDIRDDHSDGSDDHSDSSGSSAANFRHINSSRKIPVSFDFTLEEKSTVANPPEQQKSKDVNSGAEENTSPFEFGSALSSIKPKFTIGNFSPKSAVRFSIAKGKPKHNIKKKATIDFFKELRDINDSSKNVDVRSIAEASLPFAVAGNDIQCLNLLLKHCGNLGCMDKFGKTPLILAAEKGKTDYVELLLKNWAGVDFPVSLGMNETALMLAAQNGHKDCVNILLQHNANVKAVNWCKETALMYAVKNGRVECFKLLLEHKASVHEFNAKGQTPLMIAAESGNSQCVELLLQAGSKISETDWWQRSVLSYAAESRNAAIVELVLKTVMGNPRNENNINSSENGCTSSTHSENDSTKERTDCCNSSEISVNPSINGKNDTKPDSTSNTIQWDGGDKISVDPNQSNDNTELESGKDTDVDSCDDDRIAKKRLVVHKASEEEVGQKPEPEVVSDSIVTLAEKALPYAAKGGSVECIELLLAHCKDYNQTDVMTKKSALMWAAERGQVDCVEVLIKHGVDLNFDNEVEEVASAGTAAVSRATLFKNKECLQLLLENGADPNKGVDSNSKKTAIMTAIRNRDHDCMKLLIEHGADATVEDEDEKSAFIYALESDDIELLRILFSIGLKVDMNDFYERNTFNNILQYPEGLEFLLKEGLLIACKETNDSNCVIDFPGYSGQVICDSLQLLMEYGVFDWNKCCLDGAFEKLLFIAVRAKIAPPTFIHNDDLVSSMQYALLHYKSEDIVRYLLSNLYFTLDDLHLFNSASNNGKSVAQELSWLHKDLVTTCFRNPWRLETLCLLTTSNSLFNNFAFSNLPRTKKVDSLPIPDKFKAILKFEGAHSNLCIEHWPCIGKPESEDIDNNILCLTKPIYPPRAILKDCDHHSCPFRKKGVALIVTE